ncbi:MAG: outer membrane beta-barrel protein [Bacteroidetes bacterium]|nr:outer membrane beta-barrel protein [Bacteroidota bacterium]
MKKFSLLLLAALFTVVFNVAAQDEEDNSLSISGSVDTYYKYDFSGDSQIPTSFVTDQNSFGIGMVDIILEQSLGKASFVGNVAFGPRADQSAPGAVQNLYVSYALSDVVSFTGGFMGTFVGYEVISPVGNFNYSTSYLFSNGPFQNGGLKVDFAFSDKIGLMLGVFNEFDSYTNTSGGLDFGSQLYVSPIDGWDAYINFVTSNDSGTEIDLTTTYQASDALLIGLNVADRTRGEFFDETNGSGTNFFGVAGYLNYAFTEAFALGARVENFTDDQGSVFGVTGEDTSVTAFTLSGNIGSGPLKLIPEFRFDTASEDIFLDVDDLPTSTASQFVLGAYYAF